MKPEQKIYARLKRDLEHQYGVGNVFIQRIETSTGSGIPDVFILCPDFTGWVETKTTDYNVSREQYAWMKLYESRGGTCYVVTLVKEKLVWLAVDKGMLEHRTLGGYVNSLKGKNNGL